MWWDKSIKPLNSVSYQIPNDYLEICLFPTFLDNHFIRSSSSSNFQYIFPVCHSLLRNRNNQKHPICTSTHLPTSEHMYLVFTSSGINISTPFQANLPFCAVEPISSLYSRIPAIFSLSSAHQFIYLY